VIEKIWNFEVLGLFLRIFLRLGTLLELFFKNQGSNCETMDCRLILEKTRGFFAKLLGIIDFRIIFVRKKSWTRSTDRLPHPASVHGGPALDSSTKLTGARPPAAPVHKDNDEGGRGRGESGGPISGLTEGRAVARRPGDGGEGGGGESSGAGSLGAQNWGKEERGRSDRRRRCGGTLLYGWRGSMAARQRRATSSFGGVP
jgi:hypothetical protein